jgi:hypothetical protein
MLLYNTSPAAALVLHILLSVILITSNVARDTPDASIDAQP